MSVVTEALIRRAASQAVCLARQNCRALYTSPSHMAPEANIVTELPTAVQEDAQKTIHDLPGPTGYPILGTAPEYFRKPNRGQMHEVQRRFHERYGRMFKEPMGPITNVSIADPNLIEEVLRNEGKYPFRPPYDAWMLYKKLRNRSKGILVAQGEEWRRIRTMLNGKLMKPRHAQKYLDQLSTISEELSDKIKVIRDQDKSDKTVPNILNVLYAWSIECMGRVLIDKEFGCLSKEMPPRMIEFVRAIEDMMYSGHKLMVFANVHQKLNTKLWRTHVTAWDKIIEVAKEIIDNKMEEIGTRLNSDAGSTADMSFLEYMLANKDFSEEEIYTNMTELLLSGVDTTSNTVAVALHLLAKNPAVQDKVRAEVDSVDTKESFTIEDVKSMSYIKAFTKEVLRCYPIIPTNARKLTEDTKINGYNIPKDTIVLFSTYTMCRDPKYFTNPDEFIPERWLRNEVREFSPFTSLPFGFGTRSCVGRRIAENMIYLTVANITKRYVLQPVDGKDAVKPFVRTVLTLGEDLPVQFVDRNV